MRPQVQLWLVLLAFSAGCAHPPPAGRGGGPPSAAESAALAGRSGLAPAEIQRAARLYNLKCARCHKFYSPSDYDDGEWKVWMSKMSRKARLQPEQEQLLSRYLDALRAKQSAAP